MKVLWVTNSILPELAQAMNMKPKPFEGWLIQLADRLIEKNIKLYIATAQKNMGTMVHKTTKAEYFLLETKKGKGVYDPSLESQWVDVITNVEPDAVHIQGSEHAHGLALVKKFPTLNYVLSIQGLISAYAWYYRAGLTSKEIRKNLTFRNLWKRDSIFDEERSFHDRGKKIEKEYFKRIGHFIGRTEWDKTRSYYLNTKGRYHFCNEILRENFYGSTTWDIKTKKDYSIFLSQGNYPIKGLHQAIKAVALLKKDFPTIKLRFAGSNILLENQGIKGRLKLKGYGKYLRKLIQELQVADHIEYLGVLNQEEMLQSYLDSHVFVCPSSIENSPNSLAEAQILGVPCVASYVGGIPEMVVPGSTGLLYRFEEVEQLAQHLRRIFNDDNLAGILSENGRAEALKRHDREEITKNTIGIYTEISS